MIVFYTEDIIGDIATLHEAESKHCNVVLRKNPGDKVQLINGQGLLAQGTILSQTKRSTSIQIDSREQFPTAPFRGIAICPTKNMGRFEFFLEKATEIGINNIYPILCSRSERKILKTARLEKILLSAAKQSVNFHLPVLHPLQKFKSFISEIQSQDSDLYIGHYQKENPDLISFIGNEKDKLVVIGPEGDFTEDELDLAKQSGFVSVNLSKSRLRTETAGIVASTFICV